MSLTASIPRFLLPQKGTIWRTRLISPASTSSTSSSIRRASTKPNKSSKSTKPLVLEKPTKFNPPSHGARLRKDSPRYPGPQLSTEEVAQQKTKKYPNLMPPEGTFMHWFLNNKGIHIWITLGTLFSLAGFMMLANFKNASPFADMIPPWTQMFMHPIAFTRTWIEIIRLNTAHTTAETYERRSRRTEDVAKRAAYRKAHGLDKDVGFGGWTAKSDDQVLGPSIPIGPVGEAEGGPANEPGAQQQARQKRPVKKWLGIW